MYLTRPGYPLPPPGCRIDARFCNRADPGRAKYIAQVIVHAHNLSTFICEQTFGYMCKCTPSIRAAVLLRNERKFPSHIPVTLRNEWEFPESLLRNGTRSREMHSNPVLHDRPSAPSRQVSPDAIFHLRKTGSEIETWLDGARPGPGSLRACMNPRLRSVGDEKMGYFCD